MLAYSAFTETFLISLKLTARKRGHVSVRVFDPRNRVGVVEKDVTSILR